jgi:drug/metabolite transporter (DMT)-like permease
MAILLGLLAALFWGATDFLAQRAGRSAGVYLTMLYSRIVGSLCLGVWILSDPALRAAVAAGSATAWIGAFGAALVGLIATLAFYHALITGSIGTVIPIVATYGGVSAVLAIISGESLRVFVVVGLGACVAGAVLTACSGRSSAAEPPTMVQNASPAIWAAIAAVGYGLQLWLQGRFAAPTLGAIVPMWVYYASGLVIFIVARLYYRPSMNLPAGRSGQFVLGTAVTAIIGYVALSAGLATGQIAIVSVLSSLQGAITVLLAFAILRERLESHQIAGLALVTIGLTLIYQ